MHIHRSIDGLSSDTRKYGESFGMRGWLAEPHHLVVAARLMRDIATSPPTAGSSRCRASRRRCWAARFVLRFPVYSAVMGVLRRAGLGGVEDRLVALVRSHDRRG